MGPSWPGRRAAGLDPSELAFALEISFESYCDLESFDAEIVTTISWTQLLHLADLLQLNLRPSLRFGLRISSVAARRGLTGLSRRRRRVRVPSLP